MQFPEPVQLNHSPHEGHKFICVIGWILAKGGARCVAGGCSNKRSEQVCLHQSPKDTNIRQQWVRAIKCTQVQTFLEQTGMDLVIQNQPKHSWYALIISNTHALPSRLECIGNRDYHTRLP
jgi:hypothetical protein